MNFKPGLASLLTALSVAVLISAAPRSWAAALAPPHANAAPPAAAAASPAPSPAELGIEFVESSTSSLVVERGGKRYLVDLVSHGISEAGPAPESHGSPAASGTPASALVASPADGASIFKQRCASCHGSDGRGVKSIGTPDFTDAKVQTELTDSQMTEIITNGKPDTMMPAWRGKLSAGEISTVQQFLRSLGSGQQAGQTAEKKPRVYNPGDDLLFSLPTGRRVGRHSLIVNFTHRFPYTPAFTGKAGGGSLGGLDDFALPSFGFLYGVTSRLSLSIFRSPTFIDRPIQVMAGYNFLDEHDGQPLNAAVRISIEGQNNFSRNYTENLEGIFSRSIGPRVQLYFVPTVSLNDRLLQQPSSFFSSAIKNVPGYNTLSLGVGGAFDIRPTVALVAEVIPTVVNGRPLGIHRPAYSFGIQKKIWRHAFTFGFTTSPGTTVSQRAFTRAQFLGDPTADKPGGLFIGFDISRQIY